MSPESESRPRRRAEAPASGRANRASAVPPGQLVLDLGHAPSHAEADFVVGDGNELAYRHVMAFPDWPAPLTPDRRTGEIGQVASGRASGSSGPEPASPAPTDLEALAGSRRSAPGAGRGRRPGGYRRDRRCSICSTSRCAIGRPVLMTARASRRDWPFATEDAQSRVRLATRLFVASPERRHPVVADVREAFQRPADCGRTQDSLLIWCARMERAPDEAVALVEVMDRLALSRGTADHAHDCRRGHCAARRRPSRRTVDAEHGDRRRSWMTALNRQTPHGARCRRAAPEPGALRQSRGQLAAVQHARARGGRQSPTIRCSSGCASCRSRPPTSTSSSWCASPASRGRSAPACREQSADGLSPAEQLEEIATLAQHLQSRAAGPLADAARGTVRARTW